MEKGRDIPNTWGNDEISVRFWGYQSKNTVCHTRDTNMMVSRKEGRIKHKKVWPFVLWSMTFLSAFTLPCIPFYPLGPWVPGLYLPHAACGWFLPRTGAYRCTLLSKIISLFGHILWSQFYAVLFDRSPHVQMFLGLAVIRQGSPLSETSIFAFGEGPQQQPI